MKNYRVYCFDGANPITASHVVTAINDAEALQAAKTAIAEGFGAELWDADRLEARIRKGHAAEHVLG